MDTTQPFSNSSSSCTDGNYMPIQKEKRYQLESILSSEPINWHQFLSLDEDLAILLNEDIFHCSFQWIISHYPPDNVTRSILLQNQRILFGNPKKARACLSIGLNYSATEVVKFIATHHKYLICVPLNDDSLDFPIHRARKLEIATILVRAYPDGIAKKNDKGNLPLHEAILHHLDPNHIKLLIHEAIAMNVGIDTNHCDGGILIRNKSGRSPLSLLKHQFATGVDIASLIHPISTLDGRMWNKLTLMLRVLSRFGESMRLLHELIDLEFPPEAIYMGRLMMPEELRFRDQEGKSLLSLACMHPKTCSKRLLDSFLRAFPQALYLHDQQGRYPLHWCAVGAREYCEGTDLIYSNGAAIASIPDKKGFFPFMLAASSPGTCSLELIYWLLRVCPDNVDSQR